MEKQHQDNLAVYLGELLYKYENTYDWMERDKLAKIINIAYQLLGIDKKEKTFSDFIKQIKL